MLAATDERSAIDEGDAVIVYVNAGSLYPIVIRRGQTLTMRYGALRHEFIIGRPFGSRVEATAGYVYVLRPTPELWTRAMPHNTQIIYTTDCAHAVQALDLRAGSVVLESGTGSGSMTHALCRAVAPSGHVHTFDIDASRAASVKQQAQQHRLEHVGLAVVAIFVRNVCEDGFGVDHVADGLFLDVPCSWEALRWAKQALRRDTVTRVCVFNPCIEQAQRTVQYLTDNAFTQVCTMEVLSTTYRVNSVQRVDWLSAKDGDNNKDPQQRQCVRWPTEQPTHTGYMSTATLLPH